jgi:hypothetical protein
MVLRCDRPYGRHYRIAAGPAKMTDKLVGSVLVSMQCSSTAESAKSAGTKTRRRESNPSGLPVLPLVIRPATKVKQS